MLLSFLLNIYSFMLQIYSFVNDKCKYFAINIFFVWVDAVLVKITICCMIMCLVFQFVRNGCAVLLCRIHLYKYAICSTCCAAIGVNRRSMCRGRKEMGHDAVGYGKCGGGLLADGIFLFLRPGKFVTLWRYGKPRKRTLKG